MRKKKRKQRVAAARIRPQPLPALYSTRNISRVSPKALRSATSAKWVVRAVFNNSPPLSCHLPVLLGISEDGSTILRIFFVAAVTACGRFRRRGHGHLVDVKEGHPQGKGSYWPRWHQLARLLHTLAHHDPYHIRDHCNSAGSTSRGWG